MKLLILGAGAWGTALAVQASRRHQVTLWGRHPELVQVMHRSQAHAHDAHACGNPCSHCESLQLPHRRVASLQNLRDLEDGAGPTLRRKPPGGAKGREGLRLWTCADNRETIRSSQRSPSRGLYHNLSIQSLSSCGSQPRTRSALCCFGAGRLR